MAIVRGNVPAAVGANLVTSVAVNKPTGLVNGDIIVVGVAKANADAVTKPSGFVDIALVTGQAAVTTYGYYKVITNAGGEPATYTFSWTNTSRATGESVAYSGVDNTTPIDVTASTLAQGSGSASLVLPSITTVTNGAMLISGAGQDSSGTGTMTQPGSMGQVQVALSAGKCFTMADELAATAGATGTRTWTGSSSTLAHSGWLAALRPASTPVVRPPHFNSAYMGRW
jgi:hypothetical protein